MTNNLPKPKALQVHERVIRATEDSKQRRVYNLSGIDGEGKTIFTPISAQVAHLLVAYGFPQEG